MVVAMFILHSSNKTENLVEHLVAVLKSAPLASPFAQEVFLIQSQGMERWLSQQLAEHFQVWANFRYLFPGAFFNNLTTQLHENAAEDSRAFDRQFLVWQFDKLLRDLDGDVFQPLQVFLSGDNLELKRYQLAQQLANLYDQYQLLRPDVLDNWQQGHCRDQSDTVAWQCRLWQMLTAEIGPQHRGELWRQSIKLLQQARPAQYARILPERVSVFGINHMPPLLLSYLQALSQHCDVHLYIFNPVQEYWADLPSKHLQKQLADFNGHPLLVSLGQQGREFQQLLLEQAQFHFEPSSFEVSPAASNLQHLQNDILTNQSPDLQLSRDGTISIHSCHSRLREVQVLKNQLLEILEQQPDIALRDIVVMAPDIQCYAPFISAVFADIQHAIADRSLRIVNACLSSLLGFLKLSQSRFGWQSVLDLLEQPVVYRNFGLNQDDMELIRYWISDTQVRWGKSADHLQSLGLPPLAQNTWQAALARLFMGYAVGSEQDFVAGVLPYPDIEGSSSQALGGLNDFLQLLFQASSESQAAHSLLHWHTLLSNYTDRLFSNIDPVERQPLNDLLSELAELAEIHQPAVNLAVVLAWINGRLDESISANGFLRGQLTFCAMLPMRSIPFQVIALLGMNDGEFPRIQRNPGFDLLAQQPRLGDRSRRADDRYQFLEILLSARRKLIITYIGQSQQDNSRLPPSVIVTELLEVLQSAYQLHDLVIDHPLHPFSVRYFDNSRSRLFSYAENDYATACCLNAEPVAQQPWWQGVVPLAESQTIAISDLFDFYRHPQRFFLQQLGVRMPQCAAEPEEREPFQLDGLSRYAIQQQWIAEILQGGDLQLSKLQAQGLWLPGTLGEIVWQREQPKMQDFAEQIRQLGLGPAQPGLVIDLRLGRFHLVGKLEHIYANASLFYRYSKLKGKDLICAWLHHLIINQIQRQNTYLLSQDHSLVFPAELGNEELLLGLLAVYIQGLQRPDGFFTEAAFNYVQQKNTDAALSKVIAQVKEQIDNGYEPDISQLLAGRSLEEVFNNEFADLCQTLIAPAWSAANGNV